MRGKLRMNLEQLAVDSFDTSAAKAGNGTVFGEEIVTRPGDPTCYVSCDGACETGPQVTYCASCDNTCAGYTCDGRFSDCTCGYICGMTANFTNCNEICI